MKKQLLAAGVATAIGISSVGVGVANAATTDEATGERTSIIDKLATKFNLNQDEVKQVFEEQRSERQAAQEEKVATKLDELVAAGTLTQAQADAITAKRAELQAERESNRETLKELSKEERKAKKEEMKSSLEAWATENNIDTEYLRLVAGGGKGHGGPMRGGIGMNSQTPVEGSTTE